MLDALAKIAASPRSPRFATEESARAVFPGLTRDEYAMARVVNSEHDGGTPTEQACIADAVLNAAGSRGVYGHVTRGNGYGEQGADRPVASGRHPGPRHVAAALAVMRAPTVFGQPVPLLKGPLRGIARGATRFLNVKAQADAHARSSATHCPPDVVLRRWTYSLPWADRSTCTLGTKRGGGQLEWVGAIPGVDAYAGVMLLRPASSQQDQLFADALKVIASRGSYKGRTFPIGGVDVAILVALVGATYLVAHGVV